MLQAILARLGFKPRAALTAADYIDGINGESSNAGPIVNECTAMKVSAVYSCVSLIGGAVASLPLTVYKRTDAGRERVTNEVGTLLNVSPMRGMTAGVFWETMLQSLLLNGDAFARIRRTGPKISTLEWQHPAKVEVKRSDSGLLYKLHGYPDRPVVTDADMIHVPGVGFDGMRGMSPIRYAATQAIGLAMAAEQHSAAFFGNGARPDFAIETDLGPVITTGGSPHNIRFMGKDQLDSLREQFNEIHQGTGKAWKPIILHGGLKVRPLTFNAEDSQLIETRGFQVEDICRIYGVPPHMVGRTDKVSSWGSGVENMGIGFVKYTLQRHLTKIEQEVNLKLFGIASPLFAEFNVEGLLRGDSKARSEFYGKALGGSGGPGFMTVNEVRRLENLPPIDGGDKLTEWTKSAAPASAASNQAA